MSFVQNSTNADGRECQTAFEQLVRLREVLYDLQMPLALARGYAYALRRMAKDQPVWSEKDQEGAAAVALDLCRHIDKLNRLYQEVFELRQHLPRQPLAEVTE